MTSLHSNVFPVALLAFFRSNSDFSSYYGGMASVPVFHVWNSKSTNDDSVKMSGLGDH